MNKAALIENSGVCLAKWGLISIFSLRCAKDGLKGISAQGILFSVSLNTDVGALKELLVTLLGSVREKVFNTSSAL